MELILKDSKNTLLVSDIIFGCKFNQALIHQIVVAYYAGARQGTHAQKNRAKVIGSGKKPWRQKGTGRARSGSIQSPIWRSGGVTFAATMLDYKQKVNKKMYRGALKSILSELIRQNRLVVVETLSINAPKTNILVQKLKDMDLDEVLIIKDTLDKNLFLAARNLHKVDVRNVINMDPISLINFDKTVMTLDAIKSVEKRLE